MSGRQDSSVCRSNLVRACWARRMWSRIAVSEAAGSRASIASTIAVCQQMHVHTGDSLPCLANHSSTEQPGLAKNARSPELDRKGTRTSRMNRGAPLIVQKVWWHGNGRVEF
jgi:hypothetical protein